MSDAPTTAAVRGAWDVFSKIISECLALEPPDYDGAAMATWRMQKTFATEALRAAGKLPAGQ